MYSQIQRGLLEHEACLYAFFSMVEIACGYADLISFPNASLPHISWFLTHGCSVSRNTGVCPLSVCFEDLDSSQHAFQEGCSYSIPAPICYEKERSVYSEMAVAMWLLVVSWSFTPQDGWSGSTISISVLNS